MERAERHCTCHCTFKKKNIFLLYLPKNFQICSRKFFALPTRIASDGLALSLAFRGTRFPRKNWKVHKICRIWKSGSGARIALKIELRRVLAERMRLRGSKGLKASQKCSKTQFFAGAAPPHPALSLLLPPFASSMGLFACLKLFKNAPKTPKLLEKCL